MVKEHCVVEEGLLIQIMLYVLGQRMLSTGYFCISKRNRQIKESFAKDACRQDSRKTSMEGLHRVFMGNLQKVLRAEKKPK